MKERLAFVIVVGFNSVIRISSLPFQPWFQEHCSRQQAEEKLFKIKKDGAFLVRPGERVLGSFAITFRAGNKIKHCLIKQEGRLFTMGSAQFESLVDLIAHYEKRPLYQKVIQSRRRVRPQKEKKLKRVLFRYVSLFLSTTSR